MKQQLKYVAPVAMLLGGLMLSAPSWAGSGAATASENTPVAKKAPAVKDCIDLGWLDHSKVIDDQTIQFHMKGGQIYENKLPYRCFGLKFEDGFAFATSLHKLCSTDIIKVLHRGSSCGLGVFTPIEKAQTDVNSKKTKGDSGKN